MSMVTRQSSLFAAEDWTVAYKAFSSVNFQAYDYDSIRTALVEYVRVNYPENFNDYIESSEFIAIIELLAYLAQSLAFRMDVNTRENFLETAERRDSVFKLAKMLGYTPKRNTAASGLMKVVAVSTNEPLTDSQGNNLGTQTVFWGDVNNPLSYEQFIIIVNSAMTSSSRFTAPFKIGTVNGISTELYQLKTTLAAPQSYPFTASVNGSSKTFNVVNPDFTDQGAFFEKHPDPTNLFNLIYRNDGKGMSSKDTGFFVMFKQGALTYTDFSFTTPVENRVQEVAIPYINEDDVYLQEINTNGLVVNRWERISNTVGQTLNYNALSLETRRLYAVETTESNGIRLRFPDGNFGDIPVGLYRLWYRTSDPVRFVMQPDEARNISISIPYEGARGREYFLTLTFSLQERVSNSSPPESLRSIKDNASQVFYTQNRMVSAQDYNSFPASQNLDILKIKAINRTHAGHSRYIDINDPTGSYHNVDTFARDAVMLVEDTVIAESFVVSNNNTPAEITASTIPLYLKLQPINNFVYYGMRNQTPTDRYVVDYLNIRWNPLPLKSENRTGFMTETYSVSGTKSVMINSVAEFALFKENNFVKFVNPNNLSEYAWVRIIRVDNSGALTSGLSTSRGPWVLSAPVKQDWFAQEIIASLRKTFNSSEARDIIDEISNRRTFGLAYDVGEPEIGSVDRWRVIPSSSLNRTDSYDIRTGITDDDRSWLMMFEFQPIDSSTYRYNVTIRGQNYVVQSKDDLRFFNIKDEKIVDGDGKSARDLITFTDLNNRPRESEIYEWVKLYGDQYAWRNTTTGAVQIPTQTFCGLSLRTRNTRWYDIDASWSSNFGLLGLPTANASLSQIGNASIQVSDATVKISTARDDSSAATYSGNLTVADNTGQITRLPGSIVIPFDSTTFGRGILDQSGNITYRQVASNGIEHFFHGGNTALSYGADVSGIPTPLNEIGRLSVLDGDPITQTGNLLYSISAQNKYHVLAPNPQTTTGVSQDKLVITYVNNREKLDRPVVWEVVDVYKYADGYSDPRKVIVAPLDTDGDLVPDRPLQFNELANVDDIYLYEYFTDYDGYVYDRPFSGNILDLRGEKAIAVNFTLDQIGPTSYQDIHRLSEIDWILVDRLNIATSKLELPNTQDKVTGMKIYAEQEDAVYVMTPTSTTVDPVTGMLTDVTAVETTDYFVRTGRGPTQNTLAEFAEDFVIRWQHVAPNDVRIDPSISNVVEMVVLTQSYYNEVAAYLAAPSRIGFPVEPTSTELATQFQSLNEYKAASDSIVYRSARFKVLFGRDAAPELQARFRVVRLNDQMSDNEIKSSIISAMNRYFDVNNWEFGETFYFTELSSYIHQRLGSAIGSIVILPKQSSGKFGDLFQVKAEPNEVFLSTATVDDIEIVEKINFQTLRTDR